MLKKLAVTIKTILYIYMNFLKTLSAEKVEMIITILSVILILTIPQLGVLIAFVMVMAYVFGSKHRKALRKSIGLVRSKHLMKLIIVTALLGILIELIMEILINPLIEKITLSEIDLSKVAIVSIQDYLIWILLGFVLGGLLEEILFRGFLLTRISKFFNANAKKDLIALFITSILFGLCHFYQGWTGVVSTGFTGFILGMIFLVFNKNLWYPILTHGFVNLISVTILYLGYYDLLKSLVF